jgi:RecQ family ATP-dependent DNA helicase
MDKGKDELLQFAKNQRLDFGIELPRLKNVRHNCLAVELDGPQHREIEQKVKDGYRDQLLKELYWDQTLRITDVNNTKHYTEILADFFKEYLAGLKPNVKPKEYIRVPLFSARVAMTFLYLVECGTIPIFSKSDIYLEAVANSDKRSIIYGIQNAIDLLYNITMILDKPDFSLGRIHLQVKTKGGSFYYSIRPGEIKSISPKEPVKEEISIRLIENMQQRLFAFDPGSNKERTVWLYSAYGEENKSAVKTANKSLQYLVNDKNIKNLEYFLFDIFRKTAFRPKQVDIIANALSRRNVIGILPTGSGKTITYQFAALLQPGITLVIAPLISLMEDQVGNLRKLMIDSCVTINGNVSATDKRLMLSDIEDEKYQFVYIAPERLQIKEFKELIGLLPIAHVVLDEAHCVSQWGHDFRTAYLRVGETISEKLEGAVTMALTGTASCNVITDIKRELDMKKDVAIVTPNDFKRQELHFLIMELEEDLPLAKRITDGRIEAAINLGINYLSNKENKKFGNAAIADMFFYKENGKYVNTGLIFCPYARKKNESAATIYGRLKNSALGKSINVGLYHGQLNSDLKGESQKEFTHDDVAVLVATKAFGMGIDKPNIRFTIHVCVPESVEAFYQEAGRAGRDRKDAVNIIITPPHRLNYEDITDKKIFEYFIDQNFPNKEDFVTSAFDLLNTEYIVTTNYQDALLQELVNDSKDITLTYDDALDKVVLILNSDSQLNLAKYVVDVDEQGNINFKEHESSTKKPAGIFFKTYKDIILKSIQENYSSHRSLDKDHFKRAFTVEKSDTNSSLVDAFKSLKDDESMYVYIGLDRNCLLNPVDKLIRYLIKEKKALNGKYLLLSSQLQNKVLVARKMAADAVNGYNTDYFYKIYAEIREENGLSAQNPNGYKQVVQSLCLNWKGQVSSLQEKVLYYLGILNVYSDYERHYGPDYIKIKIKGITKEGLKKSITKYISSYETTDYVRRIIGSFPEFDNIAVDDVEGLLKVALKYIIDYSYEKIRNYRMMQLRSMYKCIQVNNPRDENTFVDEIYKYFDSKYSDALLNDVEHENLNLTMKWIREVRKNSEERGENILINLSHLRSSSLKVSEARPQAYTPYLLYSYATLKDHNLDIKAGLDYYIEGVKHLSKLRTKYKATLSNVCNEIFATNDERYLEEVERFINTDYADSPYLDELRDSLHRHVAVTAKM